MNAEPFLGPKLKLERAKRHVHELDVALSAYVARNPCVLIGEGDPKGGGWRVRVSVREPPPEEAAVIIGDIIHNLRSALDLLVNDLAALAGDHSGRPRFPFWKDAKGK